MPAVPPTAQGPTVPPESLGSLTPEEMALMQRIESLRAMTQPGYVATPEELALLQRLFPGRL